MLSAAHFVCQDLNASHETVRLLHMKILLPGEHFDKILTLHGDRLLEILPLLFKGLLKCRGEVWDRVRLGSMNQVHDESERPQVGDELDY